MYPYYSYIYPQSQIIPSAFFNGQVKRYLLLILQMIPVNFPLSISLYTHIHMHTLAHTGTRKRQSYFIQNKGSATEGHLCCAITHLIFNFCYKIFRKSILHPITHLIKSLILSTALLIFLKVTSKLLNSKPPLNQT